MGDLIIFGDARGRLAKATRAWSDSIQTRPDLPGSAIVMIELAQDAARLADAARVEGDGRLYLSAAGRLQTLMAQTERLASHDDDSVGGSGDGWSAELARLLGSAPSLGDPADA